MERKRQNGASGFRFIIRPVSWSVEELRRMPTEELVRLHDSAAQNTSVGVSYYLEELARRDAAEQTLRVLALAEQMATSSTAMERMTRAIVALTVIVAVLTGASVVAVILGA